MITAIFQTNTKFIRETGGQSGKETLSAVETPSSDLQASSKTEHGWYTTTLSNTNLFLSVWNLKSAIKR